MAIAVAVLVFCDVLGWTLPVVGIGAAFLAATVSAVIAQIVPRQLLRHGTGRQAPR